MQYNEVDEKLIETLSEDYFNFSELEGHYGIKSYFYQNMYYREIETNVIIDSERFENYNFLKGIDKFDYNVQIIIR